MRASGGRPEYVTRTPDCERRTEEDTKVLRFFGENGKCFSNFFPAPKVERKENGKKEETHPLFPVLELSTRGVVSET